MSEICPLCSNSSSVFFKNKKQEFHKCDTCQGIFLDKKYHLSVEDEKQRYNKHNNDINDKGHQNFVMPIVSSIIRQFSIQDTGLDFGAGPSSVVSKLLKDNNFNISQYDPFFQNNIQLIEKRYNYIICCEVVEHFNNPHKEFKLLRELLFKNAKLFCMTDIYNPNIDFSAWYYKNDSTHIFFYQKETFEWIKKEFNFSNLIIEGRLISFSN